ncbi:unnamed protein product, partial [Lota lota]
AEKRKQDLYHQLETINKQQEYLKRALSQTTSTPNTPQTPREGTSGMTPFYPPVTPQSEPSGRRSMSPPISFPVEPSGGKEALLEGNPSIPQQNQEQVKQIEDLTCRLDQQRAEESALKGEAVGGGEGQHFCREQTVQVKVGGGADPLKNTLYHPDHLLGAPRSWRGRKNQEEKH